MATIAESGTAMTGQDRTDRRWTDWATPIPVADQFVAAGTLEIRDLVRGMAGALFLSLPLLFTMEMWEIARTIPDLVLLAFLAIAVGVNRLLISFSGFRRRRWQAGEWWNVVVTLGIGVIASTITLFATGILGGGLDLYLMVRTIALEAVPTSMGAAVAMNQLGGGDGAKAERIGLSADAFVVVGAILGGFLFAFNVAPTVETKVVVFRQEWWHIGTTFVLSLAISYMIVAVAAFEMRDLSDRKIIDSEWLEAAVAYVIGFVISMILLWLFGYGTPFDPIDVWLPQTVALAYATTLGGAAGRMVL